MNGEKEEEGESVEVVNGQDADDMERQQSLFSWAEFLAEEPPKPSRRNGKEKSQTLSMFEWALAVEQERDEEPVGAGH